MDVKEKYLYEFGPYCLNASDRVLLKDGEPFSLPRKACDLLLVLVENSGKVLDKPFLMEQVWPDVFVDEANLLVTISSLRKALGERPGGGQYIETVPRRGYRFAETVRKVSPEPAGARLGRALAEREESASFEAAPALLEEDAGSDAGAQALKPGRARW
ncbi:MAG TPA: transcriptional regulator, partial [Blastocatellia bacterium]|nr:transcriptional regulator [Blastocatellia bacterium]